MTSRQEALWKVQATVEPGVEWEMIGIDSFKIGDNEAITLEKQLEGRTEFCITVVSDITEVHSRAELLMKSFLASLELRAQRSYRFSIGSMKPIKPMPTKNGWLLVDHLVGTFRAVPKFEDLDLSLLKELSSSLQVIDIEKRNRILGALEFLHDGLAAHTLQQCFLSIYGGLNYLIAGEAKAGKTTRREDQIAVCLAQKGILRLDEVENWMRYFDRVDQVHYDALQGKDFDKEEVERIKKFFQEFLIKYLKYLKLNLENEVPESS